jgi:F-box protein 21
MEPKPPPSLYSLPEEAIDQILSYIPDESLLKVAHVCRKFDRIAKSPLEMRRRCLQFRYWHYRHNINRRNYPNLSIVDRDWRTLFIHRMRVAKVTSALLNRIINEPTHRIARFNEIAEFEYDAEDTLVKSVQIGPEAEDVLARR